MRIDDSQAVWLTSGAHKTHLDQWTILVTFTSTYVPHAYEGYALVRCILGHRFGWPTTWEWALTSVVEVFDLLCRSKCHRHCSWIDKPDHGRYCRYNTLIQDVLLRERLVWTYQHTGIFPTLVRVSPCWRTRQSMKQWDNYVIYSPDQMLHFRAFLSLPVNGGKLEYRVVLVFILWCSLWMRSENPSRPLSM